MTVLSEDLLAHILSRNGDLARTLATYREVQAQLDALNAHELPSIQVTVHVAGKQHLDVLRIGAHRCRIRGNHHDRTATTLQRPGSGAARAAARR